MNKRNKKLLIFVWVLAVPAFLMGEISFWQGTMLKAEAADDTEEIQDDISDVQKKIDKELKAKKLLEQNLGQIQGAVASTTKEINKTQAAIQTTAQTISRKETEIENLNNKIELQKGVLKGLLQEAYYNQSQPVLNIVLANKNFSDVFSNMDHLATLEDKIREMSLEISQTRTQIEDEKVELSQAKEKHEEILDDKVDQKQELVADQKEVAADVAEKEATIGELQQKLAELQGDLNKITGKSYNAGDIREAVEYASGKTGVPKGVLYGFLKMETNLGANTGQCTYEQVEKVAVARYKKYGSKYKNSIALLSRRKELFYDLVDDLGYGKNKKVSCSPSGYIGQGGAMGVPQFMSDVWNGYRSQIASATGHSTPDPWNLTDGVMAMALKLKKAGATSDSESAIKKASISYLGGFHAPYYNGIVYWSKNYKRLFQ